MLLDSNGQCDCDTYALDSQTFTAAHCPKILKEEKCNPPATDACIWESGECKALVQSLPETGSDKTSLPRLEELYDIASRLEWAKVYSFVRDLVLGNPCNDHAATMHFACNPHATYAACLIHVQHTCAPYLVTSDYHLTQLLAMLQLGIIISATSRVSSSVPDLVCSLQAWWPPQNA